MGAAAPAVDRRVPDPGAKSPAASTLLQATTSFRLLGQTISLCMLALRGGLSVGSPLTGLAANLLGVREALLINGILALVTQIALGRQWLRSVVPKADR